jgi:hypothetical protein
MSKFSTKPWIDSFSKELINQNDQLIIAIANVIKKLQL